MTGDFFQYTRILLIWKGILKRFKFAAHRLEIVKHWHPQLHMNVSLGIGYTVNAITNSLFDHKYLNIYITVALVDHVNCVSKET